MSAWRWIELTCDASGCSENFREHMPTGSFESCRREAKVVGWERVKIAGRYQDCCPNHSGEESPALVQVGWGWRSLEGFSVINGPDERPEREDAFPVYMLATAEEPSIADTAGRCDRCRTVCVNCTVIRGVRLPPPEDD